jgi:hypothetical protein
MREEMISSSFFCKRMPVTICERILEMQQYIEFEDKFCSE